MFRPPSANELIPIKEGDSVTEVSPKDTSQRLVSSTEVFGPSSPSTDAVMQLYEGFRFSTRFEHEISSPPPYSSAPSAVPGTERRRETFRRVLFLGVSETSQGFLFSYDDRFALSVSLMLTSTTSSLRFSPPPSCNAVALLLRLNISASLNKDGGFSQRALETLGSLSNKQIQERKLLPARIEALIFEELEDLLLRRLALVLAGAAAGTCSSLTLTEDYIITLSK
ncbi:hypothetical protein F2Q68_00033383 [Brassica cretica]|nr:hypothetical protein F2Q68_00033383 [Brassica cretica]KAF3594540.1 hypothetical protein DY000_02020107 [Brassica cretica]